jgi:glycosyltransferase involved in cell wall biosynthesis
MKVLMISGSYPPDVCGVGDYTCHLAEALIARGLEVILLQRKDWSWRSRRELLEEVRGTDYDILHIQYPSVGYGRSLLPQYLSFLCPAVVTLHEFSHSRFLRKLASFPFLLSARQLLFTTEFEQNWNQRLFPWIAAKSVAIPIGANIGPTSGSGPRRRDEVIYFGLISPRKGIEEVLDFASVACQSSSNIQVRIIGQIAPIFQKYASTLMDRSRDLPVIWTLGKSESELASLFASASLAYLPFPDGASERRGSLKAMLSSGVVCISTEGKQLSDSLRKVLVLARDGKDAFAKATELLGDRSTWERLSAEALAYSQSFQWSHIAARHIEIYTKICDREHPLSRRNVRGSR